MKQTEDKKIDKLILYLLMTYNWKYLKTIFKMVK